MVYGLGTASQQTAYGNILMADVEVDSSGFSSDSLTPTEFAYSDSNGLLVGIESNSSIKSIITNWLTVQALIDTTEDILKQTVVGTDDYEYYYNLKLEYEDSKPNLHYYIDESVIQTDEADDTEFTPYAGTNTSSNWDGDSPYRFVDIIVKDTIASGSIDMDGLGDAEVDTSSFTQAMLMREDKLFEYAFDIRACFNKLMILFNMTLAAMEMTLYQSRDIHDQHLDQDGKEALNKVRGKADRQFTSFSGAFTKFQTNMNGGVDQICDEIQGYISSANDAVFARKFGY